MNTLGFTCRRAEKGDTSSPVQFNSEYSGEYSHSDSTNEKETLEELASRITVTGSKGQARRHQSTNDA